MSSKIAVFSWQAMQNISVTRGIIHFSDRADEICPLSSMDCETCVHLLLNAIMLRVFGLQFFNS